MAGPGGWCTALLVLCAHVSAASASGAGAAAERVAVGGAPRGPAETGALASALTAVEPLCRGVLI